MLRVDLPNGVIIAMFAPALRQVYRRQIPAQNRNCRERSFRTGRYFASSTIRITAASTCSATSSNTGSVDNAASMANGLIRPIMVLPC